MLPSLNLQSPIQVLKASWLHQNLAFEHQTEDSKAITLGAKVPIFHNLRRSYLPTYLPTHLPYQPT